MTFTEFLVYSFNVNNHQKQVTMKGFKEIFWGFYGNLSISDERYHGEVLDVDCSLSCNA